MPFTITTANERLTAAAICDQCGQAASANGFVLWNLENRDNAQVCQIACGEECADILTSPYEHDGDWVAIMLDAYLANLTHSTGIDVVTVLARERASFAALNTRDEAPD